MNKEDKLELKEAFFLELRDKILNSKMQCDKSFFMIGNILNQGSNSTIYLAMQKLSCKLVAIKTVNLENKPKSIINKISEEVSILFKLKHSSILKPYLTFKDRTYYYIVMEFCAGGTLMNFVKAR